MNELKVDEAKKLKDILREGGDNMVLYFNAKDGFKVLVDSLNHGMEAIQILSEQLIDQGNLRDEFQRQHLYEAIIDFMHKRNVNAEGATLDSEIITQLLAILENGSMVDLVRDTLSEKKKIKDLFLVVIRAINIDDNRKLIASLVQFVSNLCYGTGKFRRMLIASESPLDFITTLKDILGSVKDQEVTENTINDDTKVSDIVRAENARSVLKGTMLNFIGNLTVEKQLR
jgi:hypothetical protein